MIEYPSAEQEVEILNRHQLNFNLHQMISQVNKVIDAPRLNELRKLVSNITIEHKLLEFITLIVQKTRTHGGLILGASPRASIAILNTSKALAALRGRDFVIPEDIIEVALPALRHRISLSAEKEMDGTSTDDIVYSIIKSTEIPR
jgi:MoxR-like ATPase